uniref:Uncharacterized protein n=1 Tax=Timema douglasi TaxID=61478 RepID=A0A7R8Z820_TIMDO|nr:unnamed protein product [Timema douglasi]
MDTGMRTMWHVHPNAEDDDLTSQQGHNLMAVAAERVWEELYVCKKPAIEERQSLCPSSGPQRLELWFIGYLYQKATIVPRVPDSFEFERGSRAVSVEPVFKITLSSPHSKAPDLVVVRDQVHETAYRLWLNYIDMERKSFCRVPWELHNQIQSDSILHLTTTHVAGTLSNPPPRLTSPEQSRQTFLLPLPTQVRTQRLRRDINQLLLKLQRGITVLAPKGKYQDTGQMSNGPTTLPRNTTQHFRE